MTSKRNPARFLLTVLCSILLLPLFSMKVKADTVDPYTFVYSTRYTAIQDNNSISERYQLTAEINISANHEVSGRYIITFYYDTSSTSNTTLTAKNITAEGGQIDNVEISDGIASFLVLVTGQKDLTVRITGWSNSRLSLWQVNTVSYSNTDNYGNIIYDNESMYYHVAHIDDTTRQILTAVQSITDVNELDFMSYTPRSYAAGTDGETYRNTDITSNVKDIYLKISPKNDDEHYIYKIDTGISSNNYLASINVVEVSGFENASYSPWTPNYYVDRSGRNLIIYIYDQVLLGNNDSRYIVIHLNGGDYYLRYRNSLFKMYAMNDDTIQYWQLLNYFDNHKLYEEQKEETSLIRTMLQKLNMYFPRFDTGINTIITRLDSLINGTSDSRESVQDNDEVTSQLVTQSDEYHNIESTFQSSFTTEQTEIKTQLQTNPLTQFTETALWFTTQLTALYNASGNFKILFTLPLILGLAMYFIGRGRKVAAPNTVEHYSYVEKTDLGEGNSLYKRVDSSARRRAFRDRRKT